MQLFKTQLTKTKQNNVSSSNGQAKKHSGDESLIDPDFIENSFDENHSNIPKITLVSSSSSSSIDSIVNLDYAEFFSALEHSLSEQTCVESIVTESSLQKTKTSGYVKSDEDTSSKNYKRHRRYAIKPIFVQNDPQLEREINQKLELLRKFGLFDRLKKFYKHGFLRRT